ncbi:hypothetical protein BDQ17DRAFT_1277613 [Cyathus striatus]|nr:hypothetical protein BDQ17DRAFT_1277613 [Cyathus striatus]
MYSRPDKPLVVKCAFDRWTKRITFSSARNCTYDLLRHRVEQCFSLSASSYAITYKDDDGEITNISTDADLTEAIQYFQVGDDAPLSSAASILSGRSFGGRKITLRVQITVDYDGPSLSDSGSLASLEEYKGRNGSQTSFSFGAPSVDLDDDSITVSSRDTGIKPSIRPTILSGSVTSNGARSIHLSASSHSSSWQSVSYSSRGNISGGSALRLPPPRDQSERFATESLASVAERYPADPAAVFERLKLHETLHDDTSTVDHEPLGRSDRGAAWLRDQNERAIRSKLGALPEPSETDSLSLSLSSIDEGGGGELALERGPQGKYYYTYTSGSSVSQAHDDGYTGDESTGGGGSIGQPPRPSSLQLSWLAAQQIESKPLAGTSTKLDPVVSDDHLLAELDGYMIDKDLPFLPFSTSPPEDILTDCSSCGLSLDSIRYVCSTCGEKHPLKSQMNDKGKIKVPHFTYPPSQPLTSSNGSSSSRTYVGSSESLTESQRFPSLSSLPSLFGSSSQPNLAIHSLSPRSASGFELCPNCIETAGVDHSVQCGLSPSSFGNISPSSPGDSQQALELRRSAPKKGQVRHAYQEKVWGHYGWEDVVHDDAQVSTCSTCSAVTLRKRYKCASCPKMHLCRACYSQVHELHPSHAFLVVPDARTTLRPEPELSPSESGDNSDEISLKHLGVKCAHCLLDIVGARFHCAICDSVDICSNCESAGLPGNLDSDDGGHNSSHILIKIPYPLENTELQSASRRALHNWIGRDAAAVGYPVSWPRAESEASYARTIVGTGSRNSSGESLEEHRILCNNCNKSILGIRYQCAHCPSSPMAYSLCTECEMRSYIVHDPSHVFFKLPRPVQRPIASQAPFLPPLYKLPAGPSSAHPVDPKSYLKSLVHSAAICDRCMTPIEGAWFRCAYCPRDLCECCEEVDTHDDTHIFMVFKSQIDMQLFKIFAHLDHPEGGPPVIPYPIYR